MTPTRTAQEPERKPGRDPSSTDAVDPDLQRRNEDLPPADDADPPVDHAADGDHGWDGVGEGRAGAVVQGVDPNAHL